MFHPPLGPESSPVDREAAAERSFARQPLLMGRKTLNVVIQSDAGSEKHRNRTNTDR